MNMQHARHVEIASSDQFDLSRWSSGFPAPLHEHAAELLLDHEKRQAATFDGRSKISAEAARQYRSRLTSYLGGADRYYAFRQMLRAKRGHYRQGIIRNGKVREQLAAARLDEINAIIRYNGKDPNEIKEIARLSFATVPLNWPPGEGDVIPRPIGEPIPPRSSSATRLTQFASCSSSHNLIYPKDGYCGFKDLSDCAQNILGSSISMGTGDAGDADQFTAQVDCWFEFYTIAPASGQLRIDVEAYGLDGRNRLHTHDEVGFSDSTTRKAVSLFVHVIALTNASTVNELLCYQPWWDWTYQTAIDHDISDDISFAGKLLPTATAQSGITPYLLGQNEVMPFITNGALHNSPMLLRVGMRREETVFTNDVSIQSDTDGRIHIPAVYLSNYPP